MSDHLLEALREKRPAALPILVSTLGRDATGVAFLILEHRADAAEAAARALADLWLLPAEELAELDRAALRARLLGRAAAHALGLRAHSRSVEPAPVVPGDQRLRELGAPARAVVALSVAGDLPVDEVAVLLELPVARVADLRAAALGDDPAGLRRAVRASLDGLPVTVDADMVAAAIERPRERPPRRGWIVGAAAAAVAIVVVALAAIGWQPGGLAEALPAPGSARPSAVAASRAPARAVAVALTPPGTVRPYTLGTCAIRDDLPVDYAGWVDARLADPAWTGADQTIYVLVATDEAGRVACAYVREWGGYVRLRLDPRWAPPIAVDGCPASPVGEYGGYREVGGPGAFVLPPAARVWETDAGVTTRVLVRISPPPSALGTIGATLRSQAGGEVVAGRVSASPVEAPAAGSQEQRGAFYAWVDDLAVPSSGCWELNVTVGDAVVGAAWFGSSSGG